MLFSIGPGPKYQSRLIMHEGFVFEFQEPMPSDWWRFWQYVLFGFRWEKIGGDEDE